MTFRVSWQDYRGWRERNPNEKVPLVRFEDLETKDEADARKAQLKLDGLIACVAPTPAPREKKKRSGCAQ